MTVLGILLFFGLFFIPGKISAANDYIRIESITKERDGNDVYLTVSWTLLQKWDTSFCVAVYPSLNGNLPNTTLIGYFDPSQMDGHYIPDQSLKSLSNSKYDVTYIWRRVGAQCNNDRPSSDEYEIGHQYTTRFKTIFDKATYSNIDASSIDSLSDIRFTRYVTIDYDSSPCNMNYKAAVPDNESYKIKEQKPISSFTFDNANPRVGEPVRFFPLLDISKFTLTWEFEDDTRVLSHDNYPQYTFKTSGPHKVSLLVLDQAGNYDYWSQELTVGSNQTTIPYVTNVFRTYPGFFLKGFDRDNTFTVNVDWKGGPGRVRIQINNNAPFELTGNAAGASYAFHMNSAFPVSGSPSLIKITPINAAGVVGETTTQSIYVFPYPSWLDGAIGQLGPEVINVTTGGGEIKTNLHLKFPDQPFEGKIRIPDFVPYLSGDLGINPTAADFRGFVSSSGTGNLTLWGKTGFTAMGQELDGDVTGSGNFAFGPRSGLSVTGASFKLHLDGTLAREEGIVRAISTLR